MNPARLLLVLSLAANLALAVVYFRRPAAAPANLAAPAPAAPAAKPAAPAANATPDAQTWRRLAQAGDREFVDRLRADGFPPKMIAALVTFRLRERHAGAFRKFLPPADYAYWRENAATNDPAPELRAERRALERQIAEERLRLLGPEADSLTAYQRANRERLYGNLTNDKVDQLTAINQDYGEVSALVRDRTKGFLLQEDRDKLMAIEKERQADLERLLTPEELREYDLRSSPSALTVRYGMRAFEPTEAEFRALAALQLDFDRTYGTGANLSGDEQYRRAQAEIGLKEQIKALFPPERYAEYEIKTDNTYTWVSNLAARHSSPATPDAIVSTQIELARRFNALRGNRDLPAAARDAQLDALSAEATQRMEAALGAEAFKSYKSNGGPINALLNRPASGASAPPRP